jgi:hypothetical protein
MLRWTYESELHERAGALPPVRMELDYGRQDPASPYRAREYTARWRAIEAGYRVEPSDCPPVRYTSRYGVCIRCPAEVWFRRADAPRAERVFADGWAGFGLAEVGGVEWPRSDSGFVASWIAGSEYVKLQTGLRVYYDADACLFQGPLPNPQLLGADELEVMTGIEPAGRARRTVVDGREHGICDVNLICRLPPPGRTIELARGMPLAWIFEVPPAGQVRLAPLEASNA